MLSRVSATVGPAGPVAPPSPPDHGPARVDHAVNAGPPSTPRVGISPRPMVTQVALVTPLMTVVQVNSGVAIFGTAGGRAITP